MYSRFLSKLKALGLFCYAYQAGHEDCKRADLKKKKALIQLQFNQL